MNEITTVGVDLAKEVIVVCAADARGPPDLLQTVEVFRALLQWAANLPPCVIGMEACSSAHHWARYLADRGHTPKLMAAELVAPFRMSRGAKNDRNDAQAILCAVRQPSMRFVTVEVGGSAGDACLAPCALRLSRRAQGAAQPHARTAGGVRRVDRPFDGCADTATAAPGAGGAAAGSVPTDPRAHTRASAADRRAHRRVRCTHPRAREEQRRGAACPGDRGPRSAHRQRADRNHRQPAGLSQRPTDVRLGGPRATPEQLRRQDSPRHHHQTRRHLPARTADARRSLDVAGRLKREPCRRSRLEQWIVALHGRVGYHKTLVAIANKHLRIVWAILAHGEDYDPNAWRRHPHAARAA